LQCALFISNTVFDDGLENHLTQGFAACYKTLAELFGALKFTRNIPRAGQSPIKLTRELK